MPTVPGASAFCGECVVSHLEQRKTRQQREERALWESRHFKHLQGAAPETSHAHGSPPEHRPSPPPPESRAEPGGGLPRPWHIKPLDTCRGYYCAGHRLVLTLLLKLLSSLWPPTSLSSSPSSPEPREPQPRTRTWAAAPGRVGWLWGWALWGYCVLCSGLS